MQIGTKLRLIREGKGMSQGDIEKTTGMLRCYLSRIENGHTVPSLETLERIAGALEVPFYQLFFPGEGEDSIAALTAHRGLNGEEVQAAKDGSEALLLLKIKNLLPQLQEPDREVLLSLANRLATK